MKVVDLADEFGLTTSEAIDACLWAGVPADSSATELTSDDAARVRELLAGWIDEGFVPWQSANENQHPGVTKQAGRTATGNAAASTETKPSPPASPGTGEPGSSAPTKGRHRRGAGAKAPINGGRPVSPAAEPAVDPETGLPLAAGATAPGPALLPPKGGPTGWLPGGPDAKPRVSPLAVIALALAIASLVVPFVTAVLAIVLAFIAKDKIARSRGWTKGEKVATTAQIIAGVGLGLWLVLLVSELLVVQNRNTEPDPTDIQVDVATIRYDEVKVGDCVRLPRVGNISDWKIVKCDEAHQAEVIGALPVTNALGSNYPGDAPIQASAKADCRRKLSQYVDDPVAEQDLETGYAYPSGQTWRADNDRTIWCVAFRKDGTLLASSIKKPAPVAATTTTTP